MINFTKAFVAVFTLLFLIGCASTGNQRLANASSDSVSQNIVDGKTTKAEVEALLGQPDNIDFNHANNEKWTYEYKKSEAKGSNFIPVVNVFSSGSNDFKKTVVIVFNKQGIVQNHAYSESKGETKTGLVG